ncbi:MAG: cytochrome c oxidase assembly protein [Acidimicrobiales bacterium]
MTRLLAAEVGFDVLGWRPHPEVWVVVAALVGLGMYAVRVVGPKVVPGGAPIVTRRHKVCFALGVAVVWVAADWPTHDVGEQYLYAVHMVQHLLLTFVAPPLFLLATPTWLARLVVGDGWFGGRVLRTLVAPVVAGVLFNGAIVLTHWPVLVDLAVEQGAVHYLLHLMLVGAAVLMWMPVCGPIPEYRLSPPGQMVYLFLMSIIPTVPAAWLTFAEGVVYEAYDRPDRLLGISVTDDQQMAGFIMKLLGGGFLWGIIIFLFFRWAGEQEREERATRHVVTTRPRPPVDEAAEVATATEAELLTWDEVEGELERLGPGPKEG